MKKYIPSNNENPKKHFGKVLAFYLQLLSYFSFLLCSSSVYAQDYLYTLTDIPLDRAYDPNNFSATQHGPIQLVKIHPYLQTISDHEVIQIQCYGQEDIWVPREFDESAVAAARSCNNIYTTHYQRRDVEAIDYEGNGFIQSYEHIWTVLDECGLFDEFSFTIEIVDHLAPVLKGIPADTVIECTAGLPPLPEVVPVDECLCAHITFTEEELPSNKCGGSSTIIRKWVARDHSGNSTEARQYIYVEDYTAPKLNFKHDNKTIVKDSTVILSCDNDPYPYWLFYLSENSIDIVEECATDIAVEFTIDIELALDCRAVGYLESYTPKWTVTDDCGNVADYQFTVLVVDQNAPEIFLPEVLYFSDSINGANAIALDYCSSVADFWYEDSTVHMDDDNSYDEPKVIRTYTATDLCGNTTTATQRLQSFSGFKHCKEGLARSAKYPTTAGNYSKVDLPNSMNNKPITSVKIME